MHAIMYITKNVLHIHKHTYFVPISNRVLFPFLQNISDMEFNIGLQTLHLHMGLFNNFFAIFSVLLPKPGTIFKFKYNLMM